MEKSTVYKFDKIAKIYNTPIFQFFYFWAHRSCINFLKNYIEDDLKVMDVACGTGIFLKKIEEQWAGLKLFGIDNSEKMIAIADQKPGNINFSVASAEKIPFEDNSFDLITVIDAFYYFQNKEAALKECSRVLKSKHYLFLFYPAIDIFPKFILKQIQIISRLLFFNLEEYSVFPKIEELKKMAEAANLKLVKKTMRLMHRFILFAKE
ncbi:MAG: methyltransferase domain-containing protein [Candidatus Staskawiczbacteria bacterium]|jgi:ubiquinone/menaquinone biosynthesis C-methylase UbiE